MPHLQRSSIVACLLFLAALTGCTQEAPFADVPGEAVQALTAGTPEVEAGQSATRLTDGRWLLLGGAAPAAGTHAAVLQQEGSGSKPLAQRLAHARSEHTATVVPGGRVLVVGGRDASGRRVTEAEWFSPDTEGFAAATGVRLTPRTRHTATVLTDGRILLAGGETAAGHASDTAEVLDARTLQVTRLPARMQAPRAGHAAVLLPDGRVLLAWGDDTPGAAPTAELFEPATGRFVRLDAGERERLLKQEGTLKVAGSLPADTARAVPVAAGLAVRLSRPVLPGDADALTLVGPNGRVEALVTQAEAGRLVFVRPAQDLLPATEYTLYVQGLKDASGQVLPLTTVGFTTASVAAGQGSRDVVRLPRPQLGRPAARAQPVASLRPTEVKGADGRYAWTAPERPFFDDGETWLPDAENFRGSWRAPEPEVRPVPPLQAPAGVTAISGRVLRLNGKPLPGVRVVVRGVATQTDAQGRFLVAGLKPGGQTLEVNGQTANQGATRYGLFFMHIEAQEGRTTELGHTVWMPKLDPQGTVAIPSPTTEEVAITTPAIPGLELRLPPGTVVRDRAGNILTEINITPIPINQAPFPLPNLEMPLYFTLQPGDARFEGVTPGFSGARLYYANYRGELPGAVANFWNYDADSSGWHAYGLGSVSADGRQVIPDEGVALYGFVGAGFSNPDAPPEPVGGGCNSNCCGGGCNGTAGAAGSLTGGDPVMLVSGQFLNTEVDLVVNDIIPIRLERTYRSLDVTRRHFGMGMTSNYEMFLWRTGSGFTRYELVIPDGTRVLYTRTSSGTDYSSAVFESQQPGPFEGSQITFNTRLIGWDLVLRDGRRYVFNHSHRLAEISDRYGNTLTITRQSGTSGPITRIDSPNGRWVEFTIGTTGLGLPVQARDSAGRVVTYMYDTAGRLTHVTDPAGGTRKYTYNAGNSMETLVDEENRLVIRSEYGTRGRVSKQTLADGSTFEYTYKPILIIKCFPRAMCDVRESEQVYETDVKDRSGNVRRVSFWAGYITQDIYPLGTPEERVTTFGLSQASGRLQSVTDALGRRTDYEYDTRGNITRVTSLAGTAQAVSAEYTYTATGQLGRVKDELGHENVFTYDVNGNLLQVMDATGRTVSYTYDLQGRLLTSRAGTDEPVTYTYEGADLVAVSYGPGRTMEIFRDALGRMIGRRSPGGAVDRYEYDARDLLVRHTNPLGHTTEFQYDKTGRVVLIKGTRGEETSYAYNAMGLVTERLDPLGRRETFTYDLAGRLKTFMDRKGQVTGKHYDSAGQVVQVGFGATAASPEAYASSISYDYDSVGRIVSAEDSLGPVMSRGYDDSDQPVQEVSPNGTVTYVYDAARRLTSVSAPGQAQIVYGYDDADRLTSITQGSRTVAFTYDAAGRRVSTALPGGLSQRYLYDTTGRLEGIEYVQGNTVIGNLTYGYDADGNRVTVGGSYARTGLPEAVAGATYDVAGQLLTWQGRSFTHDANGNATSDGLKTLTWDARNQLTQLSNTSGVLADFAYEPTGRRRRKTVSGVTTDYLYDGPNFIQEQSGGVTASLLTGFGADEIYSRQTPAGTRDFLHDALGSTVALSDAAGALVAGYTYEPYGKATGTGSAEGNTQTFTGREDDGTGLMYFRARYYDPSLGRFLQPEPIAAAPVSHLRYAMQGSTLPTYAYAVNNPLSLTDPTGLDAYMCMKPLDALEGLGGGMSPSSRRSFDWLSLLNPLLSSPLNNLFHAFYCVTNPQGVVECFGKTTVSGGAFGPSRQTDDKFNPQRCDAVPDTNACYESCLYDFGKNDSNLMYFTLGMRDCQEYAGYANKICRIKCKM